MSSDESESLDYSEEEKKLSASDILKNKRGLNNWNNINILHKTIQNNLYVFTNDDFNNFIIASTTGKSTSFIRKNCPKKSKNGIIIAHMFTNFAPNDKQLKLLISCYNTKQYNPSYKWLDILLDRDYKFSDDQIKLLNKLNYLRMAEMFNSKEITIETINLWIKQLNDDFDYNTENIIIDKINNFDGQFPQEYLETMIRDINKYNIGDCEDIIDKIIKKSTLDESIFDFCIEKNFTSTLILRTIIEKMTPSNEFINYLIKIKYFKSHLKYLFELAINGYVITTDTLNNLIEKHEYAYFNLNGDIELSKIDITLNQLIELHTTNTPKTLNKNSNDNDDNDDSDDDDDDSDDDDNESSSICEVDDDENGYELNTAFHQDNSKINEFVIAELRLLTLDLFNLFKIEPTYETLKIICRKGYNTSFDKMILKKFIPTKECLDESMIKHNYNLIVKIICYKISPDKETLHKLINDSWSDYGIMKRKKYAGNIIELLIKNGLEITISEIELLLSHDIILEDLNRFDIQYDEELYYLCFKYDYFPIEYEDKFIINKNVLHLRTMCKKSKTTIDQIKKFMKDNNIKPDRYCVDNTYIGESSKIRRYLTETLNCEPTIFSLIETSPYRTDLDTLAKKLISQSDMNYKIMSEPFEHVDLNHLLY